MRFVAAVTLLLLLTLGCKPRRNMEAYNKLTADERVVVGNWKSEIVQTDQISGGDANFRQLMTMLEELDEPAMLFMREDKTFNLTLFEQQVTGTWEVKKPDVFLTIKEVGGRKPSEIHASSGRFRNMSGFEILKNDRDQWLDDLQKFRALEVAEKYNRLAFPADGKTMAALYNSGTFQEMFGGRVRFVLQQ